MPTQPLQENRPMDNNEYHNEDGWNEDHENIQRLLEVTARIAELRY